MSIFDNPDEFFMQQALREAREAEAEGEIPVGAVVVSGERILARAHNSTERLADVTAHAEMLAITAASSALGAKYLTDCTLYVRPQAGLRTDRPPDAPPQDRGGRRPPRRRMRHPGEGVFQGKKIT